MNIVKVLMTKRCSNLDIADPRSLQKEPELLEKIERNTLEQITEVIRSYRGIASEAFDNASDIYPHEIYHEEGSQAYYRALADVARAIGEDITEMALDSEGIISEQVPLSGRTDHKMVRKIQAEENSSNFGQALMIDSKAEKEGGTSTIQRGQTSLEIKFKNTQKDKEYDEPGNLPKVISTPGGKLLPTTVLIKYQYSGKLVENMTLDKIIVSCIPHGYLQQRYNRNVNDGQIWRVGRDSPKHDENFRVRLRYQGLKKKASWRVKEIMTDQESLESFS